MAKISNGSLCAAAYPDCLPRWQNRIPLEAMQYWDKAGLVMSADDMNGFREEMLDILVQRIMTVIVHDLSVVNKFEAYKRGKWGMGGIIQEMATDIIQSLQYKGINAPQAELDQFAIWKPNVKVAYHTINRRVYFPLTITDEFLRTAFQNDGQLGQLLGAWIQSMTASNTVDEELYTKRAFVDYARQQKFPIFDNQILEVPDLTVEGVSVADIRLFILRFQLLVKAMFNNNRCYNSFGRMQAIPPSRLTAVLNFAYPSQNEIQNLALTYNPQYNQFPVKILETNNFGDGGNPSGNVPGDDPNIDNIVGVVHDDRFLSIQDVLTTLSQSNNARQLYYDKFLHAHQFYICSPASNVVYLVKDKAMFQKFINSGGAVGTGVCKTEEEMVQDQAQDALKRSAGMAA